MEKQQYENNNPPALGQKENAKHGEVFFPVQKYITRLAADYPVITTHWHDEAELTLITKGSCTYQIDLLEYEAKEGDIIFIPPLLLHSISIRDCDEFYSETYVFHINFLGGNNTDICSSRYLTPLINHEFAMPYLIAPKHPAYSSLCKCFMRITNLYSRQEFGYELALKAFLLQAIFLLLQYSEKMLISVSTHPPISSKMCSITSRCTMPKASRFQSLPGFAISVNTTSCVSSKNT